MLLLAVTQNFVYGTPSFGNPATFGEAFRRASALAASCEADLVTLENWFGVSGGFGPSNRVTVSIDNSILATSLGNNQGYHKDGTTQITIVPFTGSANADEAVRAVFVAEMAEVLMDYRNQVTGQTTWLAGNSMGEALSTVCEGLLHPAGYYPPPISAPRIGPWLNYIRVLPFDWRRPNWIDQTENTDKNYVSFGCGIVFIYYLLSQLGFPIQDVIAKAGSTFEQTYQNLTGQSGAWNTFISLLDLYFPEGPLNHSYNPFSDNLFPLPRLVSLSLTPPVVVAGDISTATVTLDSPHPGFDLPVTVLSADTGFATLPANPATVPAGSNTVLVLVSTHSLLGSFESAHVVIYASCGGVTVSSTLTVNAPVDLGILKSVSINPATVIGGDSSVGTVTLEKPVLQPTVVGLAAVEPGGPPRPGGTPSAVATIKPSVIVPANESQATFSIQTSVLPPGQRRTATILAGAVLTKSAVLTVESA